MLRVWLVFLWLPLLGSEPLDPPYVRLDLPLIEANELAQLYHFSGVEVDQEGSLIVAGDEDILQLFDALGLPYTLLEDRFIQDQMERAYWKSVPSSYFSPATLETWLIDLVASHSAIAEMVQIGTTVESRPIWAIKVTDQLGVEEFEPELRIIGNIHGDEKSSLMVCTDALEWILTNYGIDSDATWLVDETEMWFVPMVNPDGNFHHTRRNAASVDLNRDFSGPAGTGTGLTPFSQPETRAIRDLTDVLGNRFNLGLTFHSGAACFNSVWNYTAQAPHDLDNFFSARSGGSPCGIFTCAVPSADGLAEAYGDGCSYPGFWQTVGADWYVTFGDTNDWAYQVWGTLDTTLECTDSKTPAESEIAAYTSQHRMGVINYLLKSRQGIEGTVTDAFTDAPLDATVVIAEMPQPVFTDPLVGDYHRFVVPGTYDVTVSASGYVSQTVQGVITSADATVQLDFQLVSDSVTLASMVEFWPGPGSGDTNGNGRIDVMDLVTMVE